MSSLSSSSNVPPPWGCGSLRRTPSLSKPCSVAGCRDRREREGYCMPHFVQFKQATTVHSGAAASSSTTSSSSSSTNGLFNGSNSGSGSSSSSSGAILSGSNSGSNGSIHLSGNSGSNNSSSNSSSGVLGAASVNPPVNKRASEFVPASVERHARSSPAPASSWWRRSSLGCLAPPDSAPLAARAAVAAAASPLPVESPLLREVRSAWISATKVVFKDLPRLAKRISIVTEEGGTVVDTGRVVKRRERVGASSASSSALGPVGHRARLPSTSWQTWAFIENESWVGREQIKRRNREADAWQDRALSPCGSEDGYVSAGSASASAASAGAAEVDTWQAVENVVLAIMAELESEPAIAAAAAFFAASRAEMHAGSDHQLLLEHLFTRVIQPPLASRTFKIFQAIHQSIIFPSIAYLHSNLYSRAELGGPLKDCRRADGWTVQVFLGPAIYITHTRIEQSLQSAADPKHLELTWEMRLSFDNRLSDLRAVILRVQKLEFHAEAPPDYRKTITSILAGNGLIV